MRVSGKRGRDMLRWPVLARLFDRARVRHRRALILEGRIESPARMMAACAICEKAREADVPTHDGCQRRNFYTSMMDVS